MIGRTERSRKKTPFIQFVYVMVIMEGEPHDKVHAVYRQVHTAGR